MKQKVLITYISLLSLFLLFTFSGVIYTKIKTGSEASTRRIRNITSIQQNSNGNVEQSAGGLVAISGTIGSYENTRPQDNVISQSPRGNGITYTISPTPTPSLPRVTADQCGSQNGLCMTQPECLKEGGSLSGSKCWSDSYSDPSYCCMLRDQTNPDKTILASQCSDTLGGSCMSGNDCAAQNGSAVGKCWDGAITTLGVCCVTKDQLGKLAQKTAPDPRQCEAYHFVGDSQPIFCHQCGQKYCSSFARNEEELTQACGPENSPSGSKRYQQECCYDADFDGVCDLGREKAYCCRTCTGGPSGSACP